MNRNTSPVSPLTDDMILKVVKETEIQQYPDQEGNQLKKLYAKYYGLDPERIELANGSDEWIQKVIMTLGDQGVIFFAPDFGMYEEYCQQVGVTYYQVPCREGFEFNIDDMIEQINQKTPSLLIVSNPQNPTGVLFKEEELEQLADAMKAVGGYFVIDECYIDFAKNYQRPTGDHIVYLRTLSKLYGMAGLRIGFAIAKDEAWQKITRLNHPYPVNSLVTNIASELFKDVNRLEAFKEYQFKCQKALVKAFDQVKELIEIKPSYANYVFTYGDKARELGKYLEEAGFIGRIYEDDPLLNQAVRYSIVDLEDYPELNKRIKEWREQYV